MDRTGRSRSKRPSIHRHHSNGQDKVKHRESIKPPPSVRAPRSNSGGKEFAFLVTLLPRNAETDFEALRWGWRRQLCLASLWSNVIYCIYLSSLSSCFEDLRQNFDILYSTPPSHCASRSLAFMVLLPALHLSFLYLFYS